MSHVDTRTKRQKLEAMAAPNSGASDGERDNALAILARLFPVTAQTAALYAGRTFIRIGSQRYVLEIRKVTRGPATGQFYLFCPCWSWKISMGRGDTCKHAKDVLRTELRGHSMSVGAVVS